MHQIYNVLSYVWYNVFRRPLRMKVRDDLRPEDTRLTVVFLHGIAATSIGWKKTLQDIRKDSSLKNLRLISLDLLGFGRSPRADWLDYDYLDYQTAIDNTLKHLKVNTPVVVVGHSMGGLIAADYATNYQPVVNVAALILVSPPVLMASEMAGLPDQVYTKTYSSLHKIAEEVPAAEVVGKIVQRFSSFQINYLKTAAFAKSMENIILNHKNYQTFTRIKTPTFLLHGSVDPLVIGANLRKIAENNSHVRYCSVIAHHDITVNKRVRIIQELKRIKKNAF